MNDNKIIQFNKPLFEIIPNLMSNDVGKKYLLAYNLNGIFGKTFKDFLNLNKLHNNLVSFCSKNEFYVYCIDENTEKYFEEVKKWGVNIVKILQGDSFFCNSKEEIVEEEKEIPGKFIKIGKNFKTKTEKIKTKQKKIEIKSEYKEFFMSKFDLAIMNPPWDIHLKIIEQILTYTDNVVNISPIRWLQDSLATEKQKSDYKTFENTISKRIKSIEVIDPTEIDKMFGIQYNTTVAVYHFDKKGGYNYSSLMDSKSKKYRQIYKAAMKNSFSCPELKYYKDSKKNNFVPVCLLCGHIDALNAGPTFSRDRYRYFVNNKCVNPVRKDVNGLTPEKAKSYNLKTFDTVYVAEFDTANECANFYDYITSPFFVYMCKCHSMDGHVTPKYLPFMEDYKTKRTNDEIFDYFKVSEKNKKFIYQELKRLQ